MRRLLRGHICLQPQVISGRKARDARGRQRGLSARDLHLQRGSGQIKGGRVTERSSGNES
jgi:hypothetical protein